MRWTMCSSSTWMASSRRLSKLPGARLMEPMMARASSARMSLACSLMWRQLVNLDAEVLKGAQAADAFDELLFLELVRGAGHDVDLHAAGVGADEVLDDGGVLVALILQPQGVLAAVDELAEALAAVADAPDEMRVFAGFELLAVPVGVEAMGDLVDLVLDGW